MNGQLLVFVLGSLFALVLQVFISQLALRRERLKERWVRRLNSYQDYYRVMADLIDQFLEGLDVSDQGFDELWRLARKAAYDAALYDPHNAARTSNMRRLTVEIGRARQRREAIDEQSLNGWREETRLLTKEFFTQQGLGW